MKLTILGGGGFRVPLVHGALLGDASASRIHDVALYDVDAERVEVIRRTLEQQAAGHDDPPTVTATTVLDEALTGADFVFSAIRVGGLHGRTQDERVALSAGVLGQETTGPGGVAYGLRTVPVAVHIAERIAAVAPGAWCINFTNPAGMITQAMQAVLGHRAIGICDSPVGLGRRAARAAGLDPDAAQFGYVGLNHLGWLRSLRVDGVDHLPTLLADERALLQTEEGRLFGPEWVQSLGAIPNEYLYYYYFTREAIRSLTGSSQTRGEFLLDQQSAFYEAVRAEPGRAHELWVAARRRREETYLAEARSEGEEREEDDLSGGYEGVALRLMGAIARGAPASLILNVRNGGAIPGLPADAVVEVPCDVDADGPRPRSTEPLGGAMLGLTQQIKAVDELTIAAALSGSPRLAVKALALHPLVDSVTTARVLLDGYRAR
ncbi:MAG: 6-phospho-beta-glucosidase, partial [Nostocoides sp.]